MHKLKFKKMISAKIRMSSLHIIRDFIFRLEKKITQTYLGDDVMNSSNHIEHFDYFFTEITKEFSEEGVNLHDSSSVKKYLFELFDMHYYRKNKSAFDIDKFKINLRRFTILNDDSTSEDFVVAKKLHKYFFSILL